MFLAIFVSLLAPNKIWAQETAISKEHRIDLFSCVSFIRHTSFWGWDFPRVEKALDIPAIQKAPKLGSIALYDYPSVSGLGHAALVISIATSTYDIVEANYRAGQVTRRTLPLKGDKFLRGFYWLP